MSSILITSIAIIAVFIGALFAFANWLTRHYTSEEDLKTFGKPRDENDKGETAVVLGGGIAGILSARSLLNHYKHVIIVEAADYPEEERVRPAVAQGGHIHLVLVLLTLTLEVMFPTIGDELRARGVVPGQLGQGMKMLYWGTWRTVSDAAMPFWVVSRPFLDSLVRDVFIHFYRDQITFMTNRNIQKPILSTELANLGIDKVDMTEANDGVHIRGCYSRVSNIKPDEFRVVGVKIKKRGIKSNDNNNNNNNNTNNNTTMASEEGVNVNHEYELEDIEANTAGALCSSTKILTHIKNKNGRKSSFQPTIPPTITTLNFKIPEVIGDYHEEYILGDIIVDATGNTALFANWCQRLWKIDIPVSTAKANSTYVSHLFHEPENFESEILTANNVIDKKRATQHQLGECPGNFKVLAVYPFPGKSAYYGCIFRVEKGLWQVTLIANCGFKIPNTSLTEFIHHARRMDNPLVHQFLSHARPVEGEGLYTYHPKLYMNRHWERATSRPDGVVTIGNSNAIFDPMFGQGMPAACIGALALNTTLRMSQYQGKDGVSSPIVSQSFYKILTKRMKIPWLVSLIEDSRWDENCDLKGGIELNDEALKIKHSLLGQVFRFLNRHLMILGADNAFVVSIVFGITTMSYQFSSFLSPLFIFYVIKHIIYDCFGWIQNGEKNYHENILPARNQREKWEISPTLSDEHIKRGLIYDYIVPDDQIKTHHSKKD